MIRIAAAADLHFGTDSSGTLRPHLEGIEERADILLLAGDLTRIGAVEEADVLARELDGLPVPVVAVLGNHDHHSDREQEVTRVLGGAGVRVLEGEAVVHEIRGERLGVAGAKGFGGGFAGASGSDFGELEMKRYMWHAREAAERLERALEGLADDDVDHRVALLHYSPVRGTLVGEPPEIYPFLGSYLLAEVVDRVGADLVLHGHAHRGGEKGVTPGGVRVRNVAQPVIRHAFNVYCLGPEDGATSV